MTNHTPGPWTIDHQQIGPPGEPVALLCDMTAPSPGTVVEWPRGEYWLLTDDPFDDAENEANARLIASAPELLAALENLSDWFGEVDEINESLLDWFGLHKVLDRTTAAIVKARGGE